MEITMAEREAKAKAKKAEAFEQFMRKGETKLMLSLVPESSTPDAVTTLLRVAFDEGHNNGTGEIMLMLVESMFKDRPRDRY